MSAIVERLRRYKLGRSGYATQCHRAADEIERKDAVIADLVGALKDAEEMVVDWGAYASDYFKEKWDLHGDIAKLRAVIAKYDTGAA